MKDFVIWFKDIVKEDEGLVGKTAVQYGELVRAGIPIPNGFVILPKAFDVFLNENGIRRKIANILFSINFEDRSSINFASTQIKKLIRLGNLSDVFVHEIFSGYNLLGGFFMSASVTCTPTPVIEHSTKLSEKMNKMPVTSLKGEANLLLSIKEAWASFFDSPMIIYLHEFHLLHKNLSLAITIQKLIHGDVSGKLYTIDPVTHDKSKMLITAIYGGHALMTRNPAFVDRYEISKHSGIIQEKYIAPQTEKIQKNHEETMKPVAPQKINLQKLSDHDIQKLVSIGKTIESLCFFPQEVTWTLQKHKLVILSSHQITNPLPPRASKKTNGTTALLSGTPLSPGIGTGPIKIVNTSSDLQKIVPGDILVTNATIDFSSVMKKLSGFICEYSDHTHQLQHLTQALGIPALSQVINATHLLQEGLVITLHGITGNISKGAYQQSPQISTLQKTATKLYTSLHKPSLAADLAKKDCDGIGIFKNDDVIQSYGIHPKKIIQEDKTKDYLEKLTTAISIICEAFTPRPVVLQTSNLTSHEYGELDGGYQHEVREPNPFLGLRGVSRYLREPELFDLELRAIKQVRNKRGLRNLWILLPHLTNSLNLEHMKQVLASHGLHRSPSLKLWIMIDIPTNVISLEKYLALGIDGVSIDADALTTAFLGIDKDNTQINNEFNPQDESVFWAYERIITLCQKYKVTSSLISEKPLSSEILEKVIRWGISSIVVQPDQISMARNTLAEIERKIFLT